MGAFVLSGPSKDRTDNAGPDRYGLARLEQLAVPHFPAPRRCALAWFVHLEGKEGGKGLSDWGESINFHYFSSKVVFPPICRALAPFLASEKVLEMVMKRRRGIGAVITSVALFALMAPLLLGMQDRKDESARVRIFFSPEALPSERTLARLRKIQAGHAGMRIDHHLLLGDFRDLSLTPSLEFQAAVKALRENGGPKFGLSIFDEEGLRLATSYGLTKLPALVLERGGRVHVAYGADPDIEEFLKCRK